MDTSDHMLVEKEHRTLWPDEPRQSNTLPRDAGLELSRYQGLQHSSRKKWNSLRPALREAGTMVLRHGRSSFARANPDSAERDISFCDGNVFGVEGLIHAEVVSSRDEKCRTICCVVGRSNGISEIEAAARLMLEGL